MRARERFATWRRAITRAMADPSEQWLFGYGSVINDGSRAAQSEDEHAALVDLLPAAGYVREWNFRAPSGFCAVGLRRASSAEIVCGVLFPASEETLRRFDTRELGYDRVALDPCHLAVLDGDARAEAALRSPPARVWTYVPSEPHEPTEEHPICQTYLDLCLEGCLVRGGADLAARWVRTTHGWSQYWLNDAPMSRRPWLHRPRHAEIDAVLRAHPPARFDERRHPEDFSGRWMGSLRGMWGVPPRNGHFTGREHALRQLAADFSSNEAAGGTRGGAAEGLVVHQLAGLGGVGKTQTAVEYCYRHYDGTVGAEGTSPSPAGAGSRPLAYGLVVWLRGETSEDVAADLRALAVDSGIGVQGLRNEDVLEEVIISSITYDDLRTYFVDGVRCAAASTAPLSRGSSCSTTRNRSPSSSRTCHVDAAPPATCSSRLARRRQIYLHPTCVVRPHGLGRSLAQSDEAHLQLLSCFSTAESLQARYSLSQSVRAVGKLGGA